MRFGLASQCRKDVSQMWQPNYRANNVCQNLIRNVTINDCNGYILPNLINIAGKTKRHGGHVHCCDVNKQVMPSLTTTSNFHQSALVTACVILVGYKTPSVTSLCSFWSCCMFSLNRCKVSRVDRVCTIDNSVIQTNICPCLPVFAWRYASFVNNVDTVHSFCCCVACFFG